MNHSNTSNIFGNIVSSSNPQNDVNHSISEVPFINLSATNQTFLKLDIESLLTDLQQNTSSSKTLTQPNSIPLSSIEVKNSLPSHNSINGTMIGQISPHNLDAPTRMQCKQFENNSENATVSEIPLEFLFDKTDYSRVKVFDSDNLPEDNNQQQVQQDEEQQSIILNSFSSTTSTQPSFRTVSNTFSHQQPTLFTTVQYNPQHPQSNASPQLTYHHCSPILNTQPPLSNTLSDKKYKVKFSMVENNGKLKREPKHSTFIMETPNASFHNTNSSFPLQWSGNEFQEFTSGQHETQKRQRKERVYKFYESSPTSFSNGEDPQSATSLVSNNSIFDSNSPTSPPLKKVKKRKKKENSPCSSSSSAPNQ